MIKEKFSLIFGFLQAKTFAYTPTLLIFIALLGVGFYADYLNSEHNYQDLRRSVHDQLSVIRAKLEGNVNSNAQSIRGLVAVISTEPNMSRDRYAALSKPLFNKHSQLRNIAAAPGLVIRHMYPVKGNEAAIGLNYKNIPDQYRVVKKAIDLGEIVIAGPVNLVQGGQGFIARVPVYIDNDKEVKDNLWGLVSAVIDTKALYEASGLYNKDLNLEIAIRGKDALGKEGDVFYGEGDIYKFDPVNVDVVLPFGSWQLAATPKGGWSSSLENKGMFRTILFFIGVIVFSPVLLLCRFIEKKRESDTLLRGLFELSPVGIALNDLKSGDFIKVNHALLEPTGYSEEEFKKLSYWDLTPKKYEELEHQQLGLLESTGRYGPYEKEYIRKNGECYPVLLRGMLVNDLSGNQMIWSIIEDISDRKRVDQMKREFVSTVSHELRTPLTSISGALGLLGGGAVGEMPEKAHEMIQLAHKNSLILTNIINDLLDMEKLVAGKMHFNMQVLDVVPLVEQAIENNLIYVSKNKAQLVLEKKIEKANVNIDPDRLLQVLANLISNAAKFSPDGEAVTVVVSVINKTIRIEVIDNGPGISEEFRRRMFEKFSQEDGSDTRPKGGTGLGLAISREFIDRMNGTIGCEPGSERGTVFWVEFPLKK